MAPDPNPPPTLNQHILSILEKCSSIIHLKQLQSYLLTLGHAQTHFFSFKLVRFCTLVLSDLRYARLIFDSLHSPNVYLYTAMITAYSSQFDPLPALSLFNLMLRHGHPKPNQFIYPHVLKSCSDVPSSMITTRSVTTHIVKMGFEGHWIVQNALIDSYAKCSDLDTARRLFDDMPDKSVITWTAMVTGYARVGMIRDASLLFEEMPERDVPSWNAILAGYSQNGLFSEAITLFQQMVLVGFLPNQRTVVSVLSACGHLGVLQIGRWVHGYAYKNHISSSPFVVNGLIDMYGKCGSLKQAKRIFVSAINKSLTSWNSMINCLALHGQSDDAIETFERMEAEGSEPDEITFVGVLNACTHGGLVAEGRGYFESMAGEYGIEPRIEHYGCMIDLLGRAGRFEDVMEMIKDMRIEPDEVVWGSLLNACRIHGDTNLAEFAVRKLLEIYPDSVDYGVMLANLYSECGKWEEVGRVRKSLNRTGGKKLPGCSWIELDSRVHQFYSGDKKHPATEEIYEVLEGFVGLSEL